MSCRSASARHHSFILECVMRLAFSILGCELWAFQLDGLELAEDESMGLREIGEDDPPFGFHLMAVEE